MYLIGNVSDNNTFFATKHKAKPESGLGMQQVVPPVFWYKLRHHILVFEWIFHPPYFGVAVRRFSNWNPGSYPRDLPGWHPDGRAIPRFFRFKGVRPLECSSRLRCEILKQATVFRWQVSKIPAPDLDLADQSPRIQDWQDTIRLTVPLSYPAYPAVH